jgi:predicted Zn-dependent protease
MMKDKIAAIIAKVSSSGTIKISDWRLDTLQTSRQERYYISEALDQARVVDEVSRSLTVYVDGEKEPRTRGEARITISPSHSEEDIEVLIRRAAFAASKSKNPWFDLPGSSTAKINLPASGFDDLDDAERVERARIALYSSNRKQTASTGESERKDASLCRINALELFISDERKTIQNSQGLDVSWKSWNGYTEFVVEAKPAVDRALYTVGTKAWIAAATKTAVELFDNISFSEPDTTRLSSITANRLSQVADRFVALPLSQLKDIPVILTGKEAEEVFSWFFGNSTTQMIFTKASTFAVGMNVQSGTMENDTTITDLVADPFDMWAEPVLSGLPSSSPFDQEGFTLEKTKMIEQGVLKTLVGSIRHADWLGVPRKGSFPLFSVSPGKTSLIEMHSQPYLEPVMFSDFRLDGVTGDFGAEIRLAYYFDGKSRIPVTGGSISGSLSSLRASMLRSKECGLGSKSFGPVAITLRGVSVTGAEKQT